MRNRIGWLAVLVTAGGMLAPGTARAQDGNFNYDIGPPVVMVPTPFNQHMDRGGFFFGGEFNFWSQNNPLRSQLIAFRGLTDRDGSITAALGLPFTGVGNFIGSHAPALDVNQVSGPGTFSPGFTAFLGWRFQSGLTVELAWTHITDIKYSATASLQPPTSNGRFQADTFLTSPVYNYPLNYFGPGNQVGLGNVGATSGIWNAASVMTIDWLQRFEQAVLNFRYPLCMNECWRSYALFGPRAVIMWERFGWRTVATDVNGVAAADDQALYSNITSNRLYGVHLGCGNEWFMGNTPIGGFACSVDLEAAALIDFVKSRVGWELGDRSTAAHRSRNFLKFSPEVQANLSLWWYPYEGVQVRLGYDAMVFFNTMASQNPIDFNFGAIAPAINDGITRYIHGLNIGVAFAF
jgi:hypothetical protein